LLDPHLDGLIKPIMNKLSELMQIFDEALVKEQALPEKEERKAHALFNVLHILCTVRGYKTIGK
jgi:hypothetical protein